MAREIDVNPEKLKNLSVQLNAELFKAALEKAKDEEEIPSVRQLFEKLMKAYVDSEN